MTRRGTVSVHRRRFLAGLAGLALWGCARSAGSDPSRGVAAECENAGHADRGPTLRNAT